MNDEQMQPLLEVWLRDREVPRPKVQAGVARVMADEEGFEPSIP